MPTRTGDIVLLTFLGEMHHYVHMISRIIESFEYELPNVKTNDLDVLKLDMRNHEIYAEDFFKEALGKCPLRKQAVIVMHRRKWRLETVTPRVELRLRWSY